MNSKNSAFTLVEIIVVCTIVSMVGALFLLFSRNTSKEFFHSERTAEAIQEGTFLVEYLKSDFANATLPTNLIKDWAKSIKLDNTTLSLTINGKDVTEPKKLVVYSYEKKNTGGNIKRQVGNGKPKVIVHNRVASLSWQIITTEKQKPPWSGFRKVSVKLHLLLERKDKEKLKLPSHPIQIDTFLFPTRLNRYINNRKF